MNLDTYEFIAVFPKVLRLNIVIFQALKHESLSPRFVASVIGIITSLFYCIGTEVYLMTKHMQMFVAQHCKNSWTRPRESPATLIEELNYWQKKLENNELPKAPILPSIPLNQKVIYSDASADGGGGFIQGDPNSLCHFYRPIARSAQTLLVGKRRKK